MTTTPTRSTTRPRRLAAVAAVAFVALGALAGCGDDETSNASDDAPQEQSPPTTTVADVEEASTTSTTTLDVPDGPKPTVVLVHGSFADAAGWEGVADQLLDLGYPVVAPANPLRSLASDAAYLKTFLDTIEGPIVLVGHSYGGMVITNAAQDDADVQALVYIAAFAPDEGDTVSALLGQFPGSGLGGEALILKPYPKADGTESTEGYVAPDAFHEVFAADLSEDEAALLAVTQRPGATDTLTEPSGPPAWESIPAFYMVATEDHLIPPDAERFMAERAGAETVEVDGSHLVMVSQPDAVVELIVDASAT